ncbi:MAG TPA: aldo/keto reductase [Bacteroidales bacterium]|nr:aldo/keto reductase [Bacteroidales bacterium]
MKITDIQGTTQLHNGVEMPYLGLGVFETPDGQETINAIHWALEAGYRHIDTAYLYMNEKGVGEAVRTSGIAREKIFVTTKVWNSDQGYKKTLDAFYRSLDLLKFDYIDLYLIHWPVKEKYVETWDALQYLYEKKLVRAIGVSNFLEHHLNDILQNKGIAPMVNQVEFHPYVAQPKLLEYCRKNNIQFEAWAPLMRGKADGIPVFIEIAKKYSKTPAQIVLRWDLQKGVVTIPKSSHKDRIIANAQLFDFELSADDMQRIDALDRNERIGAHPDNFDF